jgi:hypothetical protein
MGGAFTAVADDATGTFWNPAGLASGAYLGLTFDANSLDRRSGQFAGLATPPFGISYFRETVSSTVGEATDRNAAVEHLPIHHAGGTVVQSIGDTGLAVGGTAGIVHGNGVSAFSADFGAMLSGRLGKVGLAIHNLTAPTLGDVRLSRRARAGVSIRVGESVTVAADADLTTTASASGDWREAAVGVEAHPHEKVWVRGGFRWNSAGQANAAPIGAVGGSFAVKGPIRADAHVSFGSREGDRGWGVGFSFIY